MRKISIALVALLLSGFAIPAQAENRLSLTQSSSAVWMGTQSTFRLSMNGFSLSSGFDERLIRYEFKVANQNGRSRVEVEFPLLTGGSCSNGRLISKSGSNFCRVESADPRFVASVGGSVNNYSQPQIFVSGFNQDSDISLEVRAWVDLNSDGRRSIFEPQSAVRSLQILRPDVSKVGFDFDVLPVTLGGDPIRAFLYTGEFAGSGDFSPGIIDPNLLQFRVIRTSGGQQAALTSTVSWRSYPGLSAYEFSAGPTLSSGGKYEVSLSYTAAARDEVVLFSETFDFTKSNVGSVISSTEGNTRQLSYSGSTGNEGFLTERQVIDPKKPLQHKVKVLDQAGKASVNERVWLLVDMKDMRSSRRVSVDENLVIIQRDLLIIERITNSKGEIEVSMAFPDAVAGDAVVIGVNVAGNNGVSWGSRSLDSSVLWKSDELRTLSVRSLKAASKNQLRFEVEVKNSSKKGAEGSQVFVSGGGHVRVAGARVVRVNQSGKAEVTFTLNPRSQGAGRDTLTFQVMSNGRLQTERITVSWDAEKATLKR